MSIVWTFGDIVQVVFISIVVCSLIVAGVLHVISKIIRKGKK